MLVPRTATNSMRKMIACIYLFFLLLLTHENLLISSTNKGSVVFICNFPLSYMCCFLVFLRWIFTKVVLCNVVEICCVVFHCMFYFFEVVRFVFLFFFFRLQQQLIVRRMHLILNTELDYTYDIFVSVYVFVVAKRLILFYLIALHGFD